MSRSLLLQLSFQTIYICDGHCLFVLLASRKFRGIRGEGVVPDPSESSKNEKKKTNLNMPKLMFKI